MASVSRYFVAVILEIDPQGQRSPRSSCHPHSPYAKPFESTPDHPKCLICGMDVDAHTALSSAYHGVTYYFCIAAHQAMFDAAPAKWV